MKIRWIPQSKAHCVPQQQQQRDNNNNGQKLLLQHFELGKWNILCGSLEAAKFAQWDGDAEASACKLGTINWNFGAWHMPNKFQITQLNGKLRIKLIN